MREGLVSQAFACDLEDGGSRVPVIDKGVTSLAVRRLQSSALLLFEADVEGGVVIVAFESRNSGQSFEFVIVGSRGRRIALWGSGLFDPFIAEALSTHWD